MNSPLPSSPTASDRVHRPVVAAILAAGLSRRMGSVNKLVQKIAGEPMLRQVARQLLASRCERVVVVLGHDACTVRQTLAGLDVEFLQNPDFREGIAASVRAAAGAVQGDEALIICLGDMPYVSTATIDAVIDAYRATPHDEEVAAFQPQFDGRAGNPVLWAPRAVGLLKELKGDEGARSIFKRLGDAVRPVPVQDDGIFLDIDTPDMLAQVREQRK